MPYITVKDGTEIYYKVWGPATGQTFVFSHGWPLNADNWDSQMFYLAGQGYRCIAHDRRGHGRSSQPWDGNNLDTFADDLYAVFTHLDLKDVCCKQTPFFPFPFLFHGQKVSLLKWSICTMAASPCQSNSIRSGRPLNGRRRGDKINRSPWQ